MESDLVLQQLLIAQQSYVEKMTSNEIAEANNVSLATVSRRLSEAKALGFVQETCRIVPPEGYSEPFYQRLNYHAVGQRLMQELNKKGAGLRSMVVTRGDSDPGRETPDTAANQWPRISRVAYHAARLLAEQMTLLKEERAKNEPERRKLRIGVNWGYSVQWLCKRFHDWCDQDLSATSPEEIEFSALTGLFWVDSKQVVLARRSWEVSSAANAQLLAGAFSRSQEMQVRLVRAPAFLSEALVNEDGSLRANDPQLLQDFFKADPGYSAVYGTKPICPTGEEARAYLDERWAMHKQEPMDNRFGDILKHDFLLTSMSALETHASLTRFMEPEIGQGGLEKFRDKDDACGDIASHVFTKDGLLPRRGDSRYKKIGALNCRMLSLWPEDLRDVAEVHREKNAQAGGTILMSSDHRKAQPLYIALTKLHIANDVIIDANLAWKMYELLGIGEKQRVEDFSEPRL